MYFTVTIYHTIISKISKIRQKFENSLIIKIKHNPNFWYDTGYLYEIWKLSNQNWRK